MLGRVRWRVEASATLGVIRSSGSPSAPQLSQPLPLPRKLFTFHSPSTRISLHLLCIFPYLPPYNPSISLINTHPTRAGIIRISVLARVEINTRFDILISRQLVIVGKKDRVGSLLREIIETP